MSADAIRGYVRTLRQGRKVSQQALAESIKMALRTYKDWELGSTVGIDGAHLLRIMRVLNGSFEQLSDLPENATAEEGAALARELVAREFAPHEDETPEEKSRFNQLIDLLAQGVSPKDAAQQLQAQQLLSAPQPELVPPAPDAPLL